MKAIELKKDEYYFLSPYGLGDTMFLCGFKEELEKKLNGKINYIIKKSHEIIMELYGEKNYTVSDFTKKDLNCLEALDKPQLGKIYIAHPLFDKSKTDILNKFYSLEITLFELYIEFLGLDKNCKFQYPKFYPEISPEIKKYIEKLAPLDKIILICPEAFSVPMLQKQVWGKITKKYQKKGYVVIANAINEENAPKNAIYINMELKDAIALGIRCAKVFSIVSGYCDLIFKKANDLNILYPSADCYKMCTFKRTHNDFNVKEFISKQNQKGTKNG